MSAFVSERMMEKGYHLEQHIEHLCASQICDSHTKSLRLLAAAVVAVAAPQNTQCPPCYPFVSLAILRRLQKQPSHLTSVVPSKEHVSESSKSITGLLRRTIEVDVQLEITWFELHYPVGTCTNLVKLWQEYVTGLLRPTVWVDVQLEIT